MQSFFTNPATHIAPEGQLHLWAMASPVIREALQPFARVCEPFPFLGLQPTADLHATVLRLGPADGDPSAFIDTFTREAGGLGALSIPLGWPSVTARALPLSGKTPPPTTRPSAPMSPSPTGWGREAIPPWRKRSPGRRRTCSRSDASSLGVKRAVRCRVQARKRPRATPVTTSP